MHTFEFVDTRGEVVKIHHGPGAMDEAVEIAYQGGGLAVPKRALFEFVADETKLAMLEALQAEIEQLGPEELFGEIFGI